MLASDASLYHADHVCPHSQMPTWRVTPTAPPSSLASFLVVSYSRRVVCSCSASCTISNREPRSEPPADCVVGQLAQQPR